MSFLSGDNSFLGVDIGTSGVKVVELKKIGGKLKLSTYGFTENLTIGKADWFSDIQYIAKILNRIRKESGASSRNASAALPTFSVFSSVVNLSNVNKKDMAAAVSWEAKKVIPLPLEEVVLDWKIIDENKGGENDSAEMKVLLTGAPKSLVKKYIEIFKEAQINLLSLETETFSLVRALLGNDKNTCMIVEMGTSTTDISIIDNGIPMLSRSIDVGGGVITEAISNNLGIGKERAEQFKYDLGVSAQDADNEVVPKTILNSVDPVVNEIKYMLNLFRDKNGKTVGKIVLSGGSALLPNFVNYLEKILNLEVIIGDAWSRVSYPLELKPVLSEIGPKMSVAIGLAMRGIE